MLGGNLGSLLYGDVSVMEFYIHLDVDEIPNTRQYRSIHTVVRIINVTCRIQVNFHVHVFFYRHPTSINLDFLFMLLRLAVKTDISFDA